MPCFKVSAPFFCCPLFFEKYLNSLVRIKKMVHELCRLPPYSFKIDLKYTSSHVSINSIRFNLSSEYLYSQP